MGIDISVIYNRLLSGSPGKLILCLSVVLPGLILLPGVSALANSEVEPQQARPKVGLALSGGGSRGAAHIGVLRELERQRIAIDYIAGTSVGSIIGGLYAAGMSIDEIKEVVVRSNLSDIFKDEPSRHDMAPRRKFDHRVFQLDKELGVKEGKIHLPSGLRQGQKLGLFLSKQLLSVSHVNDFDHLPIPFRAVATDIVTGQAVVIDHGNIVTAIRASMSIPAVFSDVRLDGRILVDGGISNNLPIDVVRDMGADIVIAVDIGSSLLEKAKLDNALKISLQLTNLLVRRTTQEQIQTLTSHDILITPDLGADRDFDKVALGGSLVKTIHKSSILLGAKFASTVNGEVPIQSGFRMGGLFNLPGFVNNELNGQNAFLVRSGVQQDLGRMLSLSTYAGASLQYGNVFQTPG